jgi:hypothetical protein
VRILSIDGGGYLGLATASFLNSIEQRFNTRAADRFDLFCGTSTGAIIALALAKGMSAAEVVALYEQLGPEVFRSRPLHERAVPLLRRLRAVAGSLHDNAPLVAALTNAFGTMTLGDLRQRGKTVLITAFNLTNGRPTIFKTDHADELRAHDRYLLRDVALASSAAPMYLPLVELKDPTTGVHERFCDGGVVANSPALLGYAEAVSHLGQSPTTLEILSLGTPRENLAEPVSGLKRAQRKLTRGLWGWGLGERIISLTIDGGAMVSDTALLRIARAAGARYERITLAQPAGVGLDIATTEATRTLTQLGAERARGGDVQRALAPFFLDADLEAA